MAGANITVPVLWDGNDAFLDSKLLPVNSLSQVIGEVTKPSGPSVPPFNNATPATTTYVKDPILGGLYLAITLAQWQQAIGDATRIPSSGGTAGISRDYPIGSPTDTVTDADFDGATILEVFYNGIQVSDTTLIIAADKITFPYTLNDGLVNVLFIPAS